MYSSIDRYSPFLFLAWQSPLLKTFLYGFHIYHLSKESMSIQENFETSYLAQKMK